MEDSERKRKSPIHIIKVVILNIWAVMCTTVIFIMSIYLHSKILAILLEYNVNNIGRWWYGISFITTVLSLITLVYYKVFKWLK